MMEEKDTPVYFSNEALARFVAAQGKTVQRVICHLWQNSNDKNNVIEIIDNVQLHFSDKQVLTISCNEQGDGLDAIEFNFSSTAAELEQEFGDRIRIFSLDASATRMWKDVIGKTLEAVQITKENDYYRADSILLNFGNEKRVVTISPVDGLIIDFHEE